MSALKSFVRKVAYGVGALPGMSTLVRPWRGYGAILCYHRVLPDELGTGQPDPNSSLVVSVSRFDEQMRHLSEAYEVVCMDRMVEHVHRAERNFVVAVTFDDGYKDNYLYAYPILRKYGIPATVYVITRFMDGDTSMWWYELWERIVADGDFTLAFRGETRRWRTDTSREKINCFDEVKKVLLGSNKEDYLQLLSQISAGSRPKEYSDDCLTADEIRCLDSDDLITIGAHTHGHFGLASLSDAEVHDEMLRSKRVLEEMLSHDVLHMAYPYGEPSVAGEREFRIATECGFASAVTTRHGSVGASGRLHCLPRFSIGNHVSAGYMDAILSGYANILGRC